MKKVFFISTILYFTLALRAYSQCEADHFIILNNFEFVPSELTIAPGETVAFVNIEGEHTLNGITNSISGEPFNNPIDIFLEQSTGNTDGVCMELSTSIQQGYSTSIVASVIMRSWYDFNAYCRCL